MKKKKMLALALAVLLVLSLAACAQTDDYSQAAADSAGMNPKDQPSLLSAMQKWWQSLPIADSQLTVPQTTPSEPARNAQPMQETITPEQARAIALADAGVTQAQAADLDWDLEKGVYDIDFCVNGTEYDYHIHCTTGEILHTHKEACDDCHEHQGHGPERDTPSQAPAEPLIGLEKAKAIALADAGVTQAQAADLDWDLEKGVYDIDFCVNGTEYDYHIHCTTGEILHTHKEACDDCHEHQGHGPERDTPSQAPAEPLIGLEKAKTIALQHAAVADARFTDYDLDDGKYELEFYAGGFEYEYDIDAVTGQILKAEKEMEEPDDWD